MVEWISFKGTAEKNTSGYRLKATDGNGGFELPHDSVKVNANKVEIKVGATAKNISAPTKQLAENAEQVKVAGCKRTACIGLVLICCDNGRILGPCTGFWGC